MLPPWNELNAARFHRMFEETAIVDHRYCLLTKENKLAFSISVSSNNKKWTILCGA
jgi:hypothetical protein